MTSVDYWHSVTNFNSLSSFPGNRTCLDGQDLRCKDWLLTNSVIWVLSLHMFTPWRLFAAVPGLSVMFLQSGTEHSLAFPDVFPSTEAASQQVNRASLVATVLWNSWLGRIHNRHVASLDIFLFDFVV